MGLGLVLGGGGGVPKTPTPPRPPLPPFPPELGSPATGGGGGDGGGGGGIDLGAILGAYSGQMTGGGGGGYYGGGVMDYGPSVVSPVAGAPAAAAAAPQATQAIAGLKSAAGISPFDTGITEMAAPGGANPALGQRIPPAVSRILAQIPRIY